MEERHLVHKSEVIAAAACTQRHLGWPMGHADISRDAETKKKIIKWKLIKKKITINHPFENITPETGSQISTFQLANPSGEGMQQWGQGRAGSSEHIIEPCTAWHGGFPRAGTGRGSLEHWNTKRGETEGFSYGTFWEKRKQQENEPNADFPFLLRADITRHRSWNKVMGYKYQNRSLRRQQK